MNRVKRIAIIQSCYIPWRGFFDLIGRCDEYVVFDSAQYVKRHWHNRNRIKMANGVDWLTIPVVSKSRFHQPIHDVEIERPWADKHWRSIEMAYRKSACFDEMSPVVRSWYEQADKEQRLTSVNLIFMQGIVETLGLKTRLVEDIVYPSTGVKTERLLGIAKAAHATAYLSGPSAKIYFEEALFTDQGIAVEWMSYADYAPYTQLYGAYEPAVSMLDMLFNVGPDAARLLLPSADN